MFTVLVDSGVRHGADVAVALALGADAAVLGRAYLYGLMVGGSAGVDRAVDLLIGQFRSTMQLLGMTSVAELRKHGADLITRAAVLLAGRGGAGRWTRCWCCWCCWCWERLRPGVGGVAGARSARDRAAFGA